MHRGPLVLGVLGTFLLGSVAGCDSQAAEEARALLKKKDAEIEDLRAKLVAKAVAPAEPPTKTPAPAPDLGPGKLDPEIVRAASGPTAEKFKLELETDGSVRKLSVYHRDAAALPPAVSAKALETYPGATVVKYETEFYRDKGRVFEVEVTTKDKQSCEFSATSDGALVYNECEIDAKALPQPVAAALAREAPGLKVLEAERKTYADGKVEFIVEVADAKASAAKKKHDDDDAGAAQELYFDPEGKLIRRERTLVAEVEIAI